jgi:predicted nucleotidyltransferase
MTSLDTSQLSPAVREKVTPFFTEITSTYDGNIHSIYLVGSVLTKDYIESVSDINSVIVLKAMDLKFLDILAPLGKKYREKMISAPLLMTPDYIQKSLDVFPVEFLNFKLIHQTLLGEDILVDLNIARGDLKRQCEREIKGKLIWLRQGFISSMGDRQMLADTIIRQFTGYLPLFRGLIQLLNENPPMGHEDVVAVLSRLTGTETDIFEETYAMKKKQLKPTFEQLHTLFEKYYQATERLLEVIDGIET